MRGRQLSVTAAFLPRQPPFRSGRGDLQVRRCATSWYLADPAEILSFPVDNRVAFPTRDAAAEAYLEDLERVRWDGHDLSTIELTLPNIQDERYARKNEDERGSPLAQRS